MKRDHSFQKKRPFIDEKGSDGIRQGGPVPQTDQKRSTHTKSELSFHKKRPCIYEKRPFIYEKRPFVYEQRPIMQYLKRDLLCNI